MVTSLLSGTKADRAAAAGAVASEAAPVPTGRALTASQTDLRPPLKWAGGKRWLVPYLRPLWEPCSDSRLVEPFVGGLAVTLGLCPDRATLNDLNPHLINFYQWLRQGLVSDIDMVNSAKAFYANRARFNALIREGKQDSKEAAELFYYLNRTCYNGLCRFNRSGGFNTPMGRYKFINYTRDFRAFAPIMKDWTFGVGDFESLDVGPSDFVYADPPYDRTFNQYSRDTFVWEDQARLAQWLSRLEGPVVLSNSATPRVVRLYKQLGFELRFYQAPRMINSTGDRTPAREVLAIRNIPP